MDHGSLALFLNELKSDGQYKLTQMAEILLLAPVREEIVFRGAVVCIFYRRLGSPDPAAKLRVVVSAACLFAMVHLLNVMGTTTHSNTYIALQVACGRCYYCIVVNNFCASFLPLDTKGNFQDPILATSLLLTLVVYIFAIWRWVLALQAQGEVPFTPVEHWGHSVREALPAHSSAPAGPASAKKSSQPKHKQRCNGHIMMLTKKRRELTADVDLKYDLKLSADGLSASANVYSILTELETKCGEELEELKQSAELLQANYRVKEFQFRGYKKKDYKFRCSICAKYYLYKISFQKHEEECRAEAEVDLDLVIGLSKERMWADEDFC
eukprot:g57439.t1